MSITLVRDIQHRIWGKFIGWLTEEQTGIESEVAWDFCQLIEAVHPGDVILTEGQARISRIIKAITHSPWTHSALCIGRLKDLRDPTMRTQVCRYYRGGSNEPLLVEALLGRGTIVSPLRHYRRHRLRICRPTQLSPQAIEQVIHFTLGYLGSDYDIGQMFDLACRLMLYGILPHRWRSSPFESSHNLTKRCICSTMLVEAFAVVDYPVLPATAMIKDPRLATPKDFAESPYFQGIEFVSGMV